MAEVRQRTAPQPTVLPESVSKLQAAIQKRCGDGVFVMAGNLPPRKHLPTGIFVVDMATMGGIPRGLITQVLGMPNAGKTLLAMRAIASAQRLFPHMTAACVEPEGTWDAQWAAANGVDNSKLVLIRPPTGEAAVDITDELLRTPEISLVVLDSLPALVPAKEIERSAEDQSMGETARLMGRFITKAVNACNEGRRAGFLPTLLMINQYRMKVGVVFGDPRSIPGGKAKDYAISLSLEMKKSKEHEGKDSEGRTVIDHNDHTIEIKKTKIGGTMTAGDFILCRNNDGQYPAGFIDDGKTVVSFLRDANLIPGKNAPWTLEGCFNPETGEVISFAKLQDIVDYLYANPEQYENYKNQLVRMQRKKCGYEADWL